METENSITNSNEFANIDQNTESIDSINLEPSRTTSDPPPVAPATAHSAQQEIIDSPLSDCSQHDECLLCPICRDLLIIPRIYTCGHNVCEECMINTDKVVDEDTMHTLPIYKCPICRSETLAKWNDRPINNTLIDVLSKISPEYKLKHQHHQKKHSPASPTSIPQNVNLAYLCKNMRHRSYQI